MPLQTWQETLISQQVDGVAIATSITETILNHSSARYTLPANFFDTIGKRIRVRCGGRIGCTNLQPTMTFRLRFGGVGGIAVAASQAILPVATAKTNVTFDFEWYLTCRAIGAATAANLMHIGMLTSEACLGSVANVAAATAIPLSAPAVGTGFDSTIANTVDLTFQWGTSNASNTIQSHMYILESLN